MLLTNAGLVTPVPPVPGRPVPLRGADAGRLDVTARGVLRIVGDRIGGVGVDDGPGHRDGRDDGEVVDLGGRVVLPGFVDSHTHLCWAGSRLDEWAARLGGASYLDLLRAGGGIMSTVRAVRAASLGTLTSDLARRLDRKLAHGTTTVEVKSGYGLETGAELRMLDAIARAGEGHPATVVPTACIAHAIDPDRPDMVDATIARTLPSVAAAWAGITLDGYCESGAWGVDDIVRLCRAGAELGMPVRMHADQFNDLGFTRWACGPALHEGIDVRSVDHLEASDPASLDALAASPVIGVLLPASGFHLDGRWADGRSIIDRGGAVALATNENPGSAPCPGMPFAIAVGVRRCGLTIAEAIVGATWNGACVLRLPDRGVLAPGARADLVILDTDDERDLAFEFGHNPVSGVIAGGVAVAGALW